MSDKYTIKILTRGPIKCMGGIHGPIITPYKVDRSRLIDLLNEGLEVVQVVPGKPDTKITITDITSNKNKNKVFKPEPKPVVEPVEETKTEESKAEETEVASVEPEVADTETVSTTTTYSYKKNKKY